MALKFPMYVSTNNRTVSVVGLLSKDDKKKKEIYIDQKGYVDDDGTIWIFSGEGKPKCPNEYPYFWFNEDDEKEFSNPPEIILTAFNEENMVDMSLVNIVETTDPNEELFDEEEINDMNAAAAFFIPPINKDDDFLKKIVKATIIKKGIDINRLKSKTDEKYMIPNMRSALTNNTKMSVKYFIIWMKLLGCEIELAVKNSDDKYLIAKKNVGIIEKYDWANVKFTDEGVGTITDTDKTGYEVVIVKTGADGTAKVDVIEETTETIPVLKDDEISNFEEFFLENLKDKKDGNIFDFSKKEDKDTEENKKTTSVALEDDTNAINSESTKEVVPSDMELPKMKQEYTFKELDGESYRLNK